LNTILVVQKEIIINDAPKSQVIIAETAIGLCNVTQCRGLHDESRSTVNMLPHEQVH